MPKTALILNDFHFPFQDQTAVGLAGAFAERVKPCEIHVLGDLLDFPTLSLRFSNVPKDRRAERASYELSLARSFLRAIRSSTRTIHVHEGNHDARLRKYLNQKVPALDGLLAVPRLLGLEEIGAVWHEYGDLHRVGSLVLTHGDYVRRDSGASARAHYDRNGLPTLHGHTHRGGSYFKRDSRGVHASYENFCLCKLSLDWTVGVQNWQHGWSLLSVDGQSVGVEQVLVNRGQYWFRGRRYVVDAASRRFARRITHKRLVGSS